MVGDPGAQNAPSVTDEEPSVDTVGGRLPRARGTGGDLDGRGAPRSVGRGVGRDQGTRGRARPARPARPAFERVPWFIFAAFFVVYGLISVLRYERRETMSWDLGIFTQAVYQYAHLKAPVVDIRGNGLNLLGDHFHPILATIAPFFRVFPSPVTLLVAQAFLFAVAVVPITRTSMALLGRRQGYAIGLAYGLAWGVVQAVNFDFHEIAFASPLLAFSLCAYLRRDLGKAIAWALPLILVKEDIAPLACVIVALCAAECFPERRIRALVILAGCCAGGLAFLLLINVVIPHFNPRHVYLYWGKGGCVDPKLNNGVGKIISCVTSQELNGLGIKERTLVLLLLPTAFLALRSPLILLAVPEMFVVRFLTPDDHYWGTDWHYSAVPMTIAFVAAMDGLVRIRKARESGRITPDEGSLLQKFGDIQLRHGAAAMFAIGLALSQEYSLQDLWKNDTYKVSDRAHAIKHAEAFVPSGDGVTVETTLTMLAPMAARTHTYWIGMNTPAPPDYVIFDMGPSDWNGAGTPLAYVEQRHPGTTYAQIYADNTFDVYVLHRTV